jgi:very-short-patch-repair endonuclease
VTVGYLYPELPRVYTVGHAARSTEGDLAAALLYAGPGSMLSHATAAWWWGFLNYPPDLIHVSTPRRCKSLPGIVVHGRRDLPRVARNGLPVTTPHQSLLDFAQTAPNDLLRFALANADYHGLLDLSALDALQGRGKAKLNKALAIHRPELAHTRSDFERLLVPFCEAHDLPIPRFNVKLHGWLVDAVWPDRMLVVELDSVQAHRTPAQIQRDHQRELELRAAGYTVLRYTWHQLTQTPELVAADIIRHT